MRFIRVRRILGFIAAIFLLSGAIAITSSGQPQNTYAANNFLTTTTIPEEYIPLFASNSIPIWSPCGDQNNNGGECVAPTGDKITWIGDSYSVESRDKIMTALTGVDLGVEDARNAYSPYYNIQYGKHLDWISSTNRSNAAGGPSGIDILKEIADAGKLRPYVVLALGTNDVVTEAETTSTLEKVADIVDDDTKVILTTAYTTDGNNYSPGNGAKKAFASSHDNFYVADWAAVARPEYYADNSTHPTANGGYDAWVETIVSTLPKDCSSGLLPGDNIAEKVWNWWYNYFSEKGISGVDVSAIISGIMGNFRGESGVNPFMVGSTGGYYGIHMNGVSSGGAELKQAVDSAVGADYFKFYGWWSDESDADKVLSDAGVPQDAIDKAIDIELEMMTNKDKTTGAEWPTFLEGVTNWGVADTPEAYADLFLVVMERACETSQTPGDPINDAGVLPYATSLVGSSPCTGAVRFQGAQVRREYARYFYDKYASQAGSNNSNSQAKSVSSSTNSYDSNSDLCNCNTGNNNGNTNLNGGIDEATAQKIADYYNSDKVPNDSSAGIPEKQDGCTSAKGNCVAFSAWFVNALTDIAEKGRNPTSGNGNQVAGNLASTYNLESGSQPKAWSVFSNPDGTIVQGTDNHTGIVVGVDGDEIITIEAACGGFIGKDSPDKAYVFKYKPPEGLLYTYLDGHLDNSAFQEVLGQSVSGGSGSSASPATSQISKTDYGLSTNASSINWDSDGWITSGMSGYNKEDAGSLGTSYKSGKPNKILLHYTQGTGNGLAAYGSNTSYAAHFTIDLKKKEVYQHHPLSRPSGAVIDSDDIRDVIQIEIVGYGFYKDNPANPDQNSTCLIPDGSGGYTDYTGSEYCFAKFSDEDWDYLATLLVGISKWGEENGTNIPLTSSVTWTGDVDGLRMSADDFDATTGIVAHMHAPANGNHGDTGNIWPLVQAAISRIQCNSNGNVDSISGAKNADKQASEVGPMWFSDSDTDSMKTVLENYGDLAYRTGQVYGIPWIAIIVHGRYEDSGINGFDAMCGAANFWGIACYNGTGAGGGSNSSNLGEGFNLYGETVHNGRYEAALQQTDPLSYLEQLGKGGWRVGDDGYVGYTSQQLSNMRSSIDALTAYINSPEGQAIVAKFGAANCDICNNKNNQANNNVLAAVEFVLQLANRNGSNYNTQYNDVSFYDRMLNGELPLNIDCTGTASLIMYKAYGANQRFTTFSISGNALYEKIDKKDVRPGDIFIYNVPGNEHGGIVVEASNGVVTKTFEVGGSEGRSGENHNMGYNSDGNSYTIQTINSSWGEIYRYKGGS